jgi:hypothetical protein
MKPANVLRMAYVNKKTEVSRPNYESVIGIAFRIMLLNCG